MQFRDRRRGFLRIEPSLLASLVVIMAAMVFPLGLLAQHKAGAVKAVGGKAMPVKAAPVNPDTFWTNRVEPLLDKQCLKCHAGVRQQGGLDLRSLDTILRGGGSGPAVIPGKPNESRVLQFIAPKSEMHMPPDPKKQLSVEEIGILRTWISLLPAPKSKLASGTSTNTTWVPEYLADYRRTYQSHEVVPANVSGSAAIDWFLQTDWKRDSIEPARLCDDPAFARRIYLDVAGRIPSREELKLFSWRRAQRQAVVAYRFSDHFGRLCTPHAGGVRYSSDGQARRQKRAGAGGSRLERLP